MEFRELLGEKGGRRVVGRGDGGEGLGEQEGLGIGLRVVEEDETRGGEDTEMDKMVQQSVRQRLPSDRELVQFLSLTIQLCYLLFP